eukprot:357827-Chlamydomonas_euryale.AAC.1
MDYICACASYPLRCGAPPPRRTCLAARTTLPAALLSPSRAPAARLHHVPQPLERAASAAACALAALAVARAHVAACALAIHAAARAHVAACALATHAAACAHVAACALATHAAACVYAAARAHVAACALATHAAACCAHAAARPPARSPIHVHIHQCKQVLPVRVQRLHPRVAVRIHHAAAAAAATRRQPRHAAVAEHLARRRRQHQPPGVAHVQQPRNSQHVVPPGRAVPLDVRGPFGGQHVPGFVWPASATRSAQSESASCVALL